LATEDTEGTELKDVNRITEAIIGSAIEVHRLWVQDCSKQPMKLRSASNWRTVA